MVPKSLFEEAALHEYVQKDIDVKPNDFITYDVEPSTDWICVYAPFVNVNNMLLDAFGSFSYYHAVSVWLSALSRHTPNFLRVIKVNKMLKLFNVFITSDAEILRILA